MADRLGLAQTLHSLGTDTPQGPRAPGSRSGTSPARDGATRFHGNGTAPATSANGSNGEPWVAAGDGQPRIRIRRLRRVSGPFTAIPQLRRERFDSV